MTTSAKAPSFSFYLSCDVNLQVRLKVSHLLIGSSVHHVGLHAEQTDMATASSSSSQPSFAMHVVARLTSDDGDQELALETYTCYRNCLTLASGGGEEESSNAGACIWNEMLTFCVKVRHWLLEKPCSKGPSSCYLSHPDIGPLIILAPPSPPNLQYRDLPHDSLLSLSVVEVCEGHPPVILGGTTLPLFNKKVSQHGIST